MAEMTDEEFRRAVAGARAFTALILRATPQRNQPGAEAIIVEHAKRNFALREQGLLQIVVTIADETDVRGIGIFSATPEEVRSIYEDDPAVKAGLFTFEVHPCQGFPGDALKA